LLLGIRAKLTACSRYEPSGVSLDPLRRDALARRRCRVRGHHGPGWRRSRHVLEGLVRRRRRVITCNSARCADRAATSATPTRIDRIVTHGAEVDRARHGDDCRQLCA